MTDPDPLDPALDGTETRVLPPPSLPMAVARNFVTERCKGTDNALTLRHWRGGGGVDGAALGRGRTARGPRRCIPLHRERRLSRRGEVPAVGAEPPEDRGPARSARRHRPDTRQGRDADVARRSTSTAARSWPPQTGCSTSQVVSCSPHNPRFFNATSVPFDYDPAALDPERWEAFLGDLWDD